MQPVKVSPKSKKAKNRFANLMESDPICFIEQVKGSRLFLSSANKKYFFWMNEHNDPDWIVIVPD